VLIEPALTQKEKNNNNNLPLARSNLMGDCKCSVFNLRTAYLVPEFMVQVSANDAVVHGASHRDVPVIFFLDVVDGVSEDIGVVDFARNSGE